jgi:hypothetical protein
MPGVLMRLIPKQTMLVYPAAMTVLVVKAIDISQYKEATLLIRVHSGGNSNGASLTFNVYVDDPTTEDPATDFYATGSLLANPTLTGFSTVSLTVAALGPGGTGANTGGLLRLHVVAGGAGSQTTAVISVDLSLKS